MKASRFSDAQKAFESHQRELDRPGEDLALLDRDIAQDALEDAAIHRLLTIAGINLTVAPGLLAAIGSIDRFTSPQKLSSYFRLNLRVRQSGLGAAHHGRMSRAGRSHARAMLVQAALAAAKAPGPPRGFFIRVCAEKGLQIAAVAVSRKLAHAHEEGGLPLGAPRARSRKRRAMEPAAGKPQKKGGAQGPAYACNVKALRNQEMQSAERAQESYEHFVAAWGATTEAPTCKSREPSRNPGRVCGRLTSARHG